MTRPSRLGRPRPVQTVTSLGGGSGNSGEALISTGSNSSTEWLSVIQRISADGNPVNGPYVNFAAGSNITLTRDAGPLNSVPSNTIRIHATGGAASFGSNATRVSKNSSVGASTNSAREDHIHDGIGTVTASSSNTMSRGTLNLRPGGGIALNPTDTDGDGVFDTLTIENTRAAGSGGGGGSGATTTSYLGYNTIGGTQETATNQRVIAKAITPSSNGTILSIDLYCREVSDGLQTFRIAIYEDNAGALGKILASTTASTLAFTNNPTFGDGSTTSIARWVSTPITLSVTGGTTYWISLHIEHTANTRLFYDSSGTDRRYDSGGNFHADGGRYTQTDTTRKYSIRALFLS